MVTMARNLPTLRPLPPTDPSVSGQTRVEDPSRFGAEIRHLRQAKRMTLQSLAESAGISIGLLSQLERGRSTLTIGALQKISKALAVPMSFFFSKADGPRGAEDDIVVRAQQRRQLTFPGLGIREDLLSPDLSGPIEMLLSLIEPGADCGEAYCHQGDEAGFLLSGSLDLWVGERHFLLKAGDSFSFNSSLPHRYRNNGEVVTRIIWIITPPFY